MNDELANLVDSHQATRKERLRLEREARVLQSRENSLKAELLHVMISQAMEEIEGTDVMLQHYKKTKVKATDWNAIHEYIRDTGAIDLVQRRLTESAVTARLEDGFLVPGIDIVQEDDFNIIPKGKQDE